MKTQKNGYARVSTLDQNLERQLDMLLLSDPKGYRCGMEKRSTGMGNISGHTGSIRIVHEIGSIARHKMAKNSFSTKRSRKETILKSPGKKYIINIL